MQGKLGQPMGNFTHNAQHMAYSQNQTKKTNNICPVVDQLQNFAGCFCTPHIFVHIFLEFGKQVGEATVPEIQRTSKDIAFPSDILGHPVELCITLGESQDPYRCRCANSGAGASSARSCHSGDNCWSIRVAHSITGDPIT